jgi:DivIVA domain-containing protein
LASGTLRLLSPIVTRRYGVALDRQSIEKKDFPVGDRGYDPDAVNAHLAALAGEVEEYQRSAGGRETLASAASGHVRAIVEAAESSAAEILREAENRAREVRDEAAEQARLTREQAGEQAREYVGRVSESTAATLQRIEAMEQELSAMIASLRAGSDRLSADLKLVEGNLFDMPGMPPPQPAPEAVELQGVIGDPDPPSDHAQSHAGNGDDSEGARLIALNMALNGTPREETARYLSENFQLSDAGGLLDEVYASVEG